MRTMSVLAMFLLASASAGACVALDTDSAQQRDDVRGDDDDDDGGGDGDRDDCKIEGGAIGQIGATVRRGDVTIVFEDWIPKADSPGEYVGFLLSVDDVAYVVKAGGARYAAAGAAWMNPYGDEGPEASGISNVDFCDPEPPDCGGCPPDDGGGDDVPEID